MRKLNQKLSNIKKDRKDLSLSSAQFYDYNYSDILWIESSISI